MIESRIGAGGMGTVYRARHAEVGRLFAIKVLHASLQPEPKVVARFRREAELAGRLRHENVVSVVDMGLTDKHEQYLVMDFAPGTCLTDLIEDGPMDARRVVELARQLCAGLQHAHDAGLIHRDFKPDNVIVERLDDGREHARIVDFGVAILRQHADDTDGGERLTEKGMVVGTPNYMAPEQARGMTCDHRMDQFALGIMVYEMLCGGRPYCGSGVEVARMHVYDPTPAMSELAPHVSVDPVLEAFVRKLLEKEPDDRFANARAAREVLELYVRDRSAAAALLGVAEEPITSELPPLQQLAAVGRSRTAQVSLQPYGELLPEAEDVDELPRRSHRGLAVGAAVSVLLVVAMVWFVRRPRPTAPVQHAAHEPAASIGPSPRPASPPATTVPEPVAPESPPSVPEPSVQVPHHPGPAAITTKKATPSVPAAPGAAPTVEELAALYASVGRALTAASKADSGATIDLWPRYRWIRFMEAAKTPEKRAAAAAILRRLQDDLRALEK